MSDKPTNNVQLNLGMIAGRDLPEPGLACVFIDGVPIHNVEYVSTQAQPDSYTTVTLKFMASIGGFTATSEPKVKA